MSRTNFCPNCGAPDYGTPYCPRCQAPMDRGEASRPDPSAAPGTPPGIQPEIPQGIQIDTGADIPPVRLAGFFRRFFALFTDYLILGILGDIISMSYHAGAGGSFHTMRFHVFFGVSSVLALIYFTVLIGESGQTIGKMLLGVRVVRTDGSSVSYPRALGRAFGYYVSSLLFSLGFIWAAFDRRNQAWHDKLADTLVIRT